MSIAIGIRSKGSCRQKQHLFSGSLKAIYVAVWALGQLLLTGRQAVRRKCDLVGTYSEFYIIVYLSAFLLEAIYFWVDP